MRKKIRLTERELIKLVNRVINEQDENPDDVPVGYKPGPDLEMLAKEDFIKDVEFALRTLKSRQVNKYRIRGEVPFSGEHGQLDEFMSTVEQAAESARIRAK
jgi:hypothetical protein